LVPIKLAKRRRSRWLGVIVVGVPVALLVWGFLIEPGLFVIHRQTITLGDCMNGRRGPRLVAVSDLHIGSPHTGIDKLAAVVRAINAERPDLVVLLGDFVISGMVGGQFVPPQAIAQGLGGLRASQGVYAVLGNHDYWSDERGIISSLRSQGITVLRNASVMVPVGEGQGVLRLVGIDDPVTRHDDVDAALKAAKPNETIIFLAHTPDIYPRLLTAWPGPFLLLAGHTHGGQVNLPLIGRPRVPSSYGERYAAGLIEESPGRKLFVTTGVGTSIYPVRFGVIPEAVVLETRVCP
jgi:predicted MPP superfamily phosphohydrolase